jgi:hypothetical protein
MDRRTFLAAATGGVSTAFAGCLDRADTGATPQPNAGTATPQSGVTVADIIVRKAVTYESSMESGGVLAERGRQYVVATVRSERALSPSAFAFEADGESWEPGLPDTAGAVNYAVAGREGGAVGSPLGVDGSYLAFAVPSPLSASNARIRYEGAGGGEWPLPETARDRLGAPEPAFELTGLSVPQTVSQGQPMTVSLTVENVAETGGRFLAAVYWPTELIADDDESHVVERTVDAGEEIDPSVTIDTQYTTDEDGDIRLRVRGHVTADREVSVTDASPPG